MQKVIDFFKSNKAAFVWTICYAVVVWAILRFMFNFDVFHGYDWWRLMHSRLHGFGAFVFGVLVVAAIPVYVASVAIVWRNKAPLITIPVPKFLQKKEIPADEPGASNDDSENTKAQLPDDLPSELHGHFLRSRSRMGQTVISEINKITVPVEPDVAPVLQNADDNDLPLPPDFDIESDFDDNQFDINAPVFSDVNFDDDSDDVSDETTPGVVAEYLAAMGRNIDVVDDIVVCDDCAIITHNDDAFWIADDDAWFAAGQQIESPVARVMRFAKKRKLTPVLFLAADNIMALDEKIAQWSESGLRVVRDISELDTID